MIIKLSDNIKNNIQAEYAAFIDKYIDKLPANHSVMYLYCIRSASEKSITSSFVAENLKVNEKDVEDMFNYLSLLSLAEINGNTSVITGVSGEAKTILREKPEYSVDEITYIKGTNTDVKKLLSESERILGRFLSYNDMKTVYSFYDYYKLPVDVIVVLMEYCVSRDKRNLSYMEKSVLDWAESGIDTAEKAYERIDSFSTETTSILKAMGISGRTLIPAEREFIKKWKNDWGFSLEMILLACEKSATKTGKASFPYADTILSNWHDKGISTIEKAKLEEEEFSNKFNKDNGRNTAPKGKNQFTNFKQRTYDNKALEKMLFNKYNKREDK